MKGRIWKPGEFVAATLSLSLMLSLLGCGVKGDPLPPEQPVELGRGRPAFEQATQGKTLDPQIPAEDENWRNSFEEDESGAPTKAKKKSKPKERE